MIRLLRWVRNKRRWEGDRGRKGEREHQRTFCTSSGTLPSVTRSTVPCRKCTTLASRVGKYYLTLVGGVGVKGLGIILIKFNYHSSRIIDNYESTCHSEPAGSLFR